MSHELLLKGRTPFLPTANLLNGGKRPSRPCLCLWLNVMATISNSLNKHRLYTLSKWLSLISLSLSELHLKVYFPPKNSFLQKWQGKISKHGNCFLFLKSLTLSSCVAVWKALVLTMSHEYPIFTVKSTFNDFFVQFFQFISYLSDSQDTFIDWCTFKRARRVDFICFISRNHSSHS